MKANCFILAVLLLIGCGRDKPTVPEIDPDIELTEKEEFEKQFQIPDGFDFSSVKDYSFSISFLNGDDEKIPYVFYEIYSENPQPDTTSVGVTNSDAVPFLSGLSEENEKTTIFCKLPVGIDKLYLKSSYAGFPSVVEIPVSNSIPDIVLGGGRDTQKSSQSNLIKSIQIDGFTYLGTFDSSGLPDYLELPSDKYDDTFMDDVFATFPPYQPLDDSHPTYFDDSGSTLLNIVESAEVWVTFVHERAGYRSSLGYFHFPTNDPPTSVEDIDQLNIIFPNTSFEGSGGSLHTGDKVALKYKNPTTGQFEERFPEGTSIGWVFVANGWVPQENAVKTDNRNVWYSIDDFNAETDPELRKHIVTVKDEKRDILLTGIEDLHRETKSNDGFNDVIFYISLSNFDAVESSEFKEIDEPTDSDNDYISDKFDEYPNDPKRAYNYYYPGEEVYNSLIFEDLWPSTGDYDFNDMVIDYNIHFIASPRNELVTLIMKLKLRATGAGFNNGFGIEFPFPASQVISTTGFNITEGTDVVTLGANGVEQGQTNAVYIVFDDSYKNLHYLDGVFINTSENATHIASTEFTITSELNLGIKKRLLKGNFFNPFLIQNLDRSIEVHLPNHPPTELADMSLLGTKEDRSLVNTKYYVTDIGLPWVMDIPNSFQYPIEKKTISSCYNHFVSWCNGGGALFTDWMENSPNYRNDKNIYKK